MVNCYWLLVIGGTVGRWTVDGGRWAVDGGRGTGKTWKTGRKEKRKGGRLGGNGQALAVHYDIHILFQISIQSEMKTGIFLRNKP